MVLDLPLKSNRALSHVVRIGQSLQGPTRGCSGMRVQRRWGKQLRVKVRNYQFRVKRNKASCSKARSCVVRCNRSVKCLDKRVEEVLLRNVSDLYPYYLLNPLAIRGFERTKTPNIKRLEKVGRMGRYIKYNNVIRLIETFEVDRVVAFVAVKDKQLIYSFCIALSSLVEMFQLIEANLIYYLAIFAYKVSSQERRVTEPGHL